MNFYYSFWQTRYRPVNLQLDMWRLSVELVKKSHPKSKICLITDSKSAPLFKTFGFSSISTKLDGIQDFQKVWSLGKIYAYKEALKDGPFIHIDADVFLWQPLPDNLLSSKLFAQSEDKEVWSDPGYVSLEEVLQKYKKLPKAWKKILDAKENFKTINMGIFGGTDTKVISKYCDFVLNMVADKEYQDLWAGVGLGKDVVTCLACMVEQLNLAHFVRENKIKPTFLLDDVEDSTKKAHLRYTHLMGLKNNPEIMRSISKRVRTTPYNLKPRQPGFTSW